MILIIDIRCIEVHYQTCIIGGFLWKCSIYRYLTGSWWFWTDRCFKQNTNFKQNNSVKGRRRYPDIFCEKVHLKLCNKHRKIPVLDSLLNKVVSFFYFLPERDSQVKIFPCDSCNILKTFFKYISNSYCY